MSVPERSEIVIVGGGVVGSSIAHHLAQRSRTDVTLVERTSLTHRELEAKTGHATGWRGVGGVRVASSEGRWEELQLLKRRNIGWPEDQGRTGLFFLGRTRGIVINVLAVTYGAFMALNLIWPRTEIYGEGVYAYGGVIFIVVVLAVGGAYYYTQQQGQERAVAAEHRVAAARTDEQDSPA